MGLTSHLLAQEAHRHPPHPPQAQSHNSLPLFSLQTGAFVPTGKPPPTHTDSGLGDILGPPHTEASEPGSPLLTHWVPLALSPPPSSDVISKGPTLTGDQRNTSLPQGVWWLIGILCPWRGQTSLKPDSHKAFHCHDIFLWFQPLEKETK